MILFVLAIVLTWGIQDAFGIKTELKILIIVIPICFVPVAIDTVSRFLLPYLDALYFLFLIFFSALMATLFHPLYESYRFETKEKQRGEASVSEDEKRNILKDSDQLFKYVMDHPQMRAKFKDFCIRSWTMENFLFWEEASLFSNSRGKEMGAKDAIRIMKQYILPGADREINIDHDVREAIIEKIQADSITDQIFNQALSFSLILFWF